MSVNAEILHTIPQLRELGFYMHDAPVGILCYDPAGSGNDRDAMVLLQREEWRRGELNDPDLAVETIYRMMYCEEMDPTFEAPDKIARALTVLRQMRVWQAKRRLAEVYMTVERNGVGYAMADHLKRQTKTQIIGYNTVGVMTDKKFQNKQMSMPRLAALDLMRVCLETHRLKMEKRAIGANIIASQINSFVWKRPGRPEAIEGMRDDVIMAICGGIWFGTHAIPMITKHQPGGPAKQASGGGIRRR